MAEVSGKELHDWAWRVVQWDLIAVGSDIIGFKVRHPYFQWTVPGFVFVSPNFSAYPYLFTGSLVFVIRIKLPIFSFIPFSFSLKPQGSYPFWIYLCIFFGNKIWWNICRNEIFSLINSSIDLDRKSIFPRYRYIDIVWIHYILLIVLVCC